MPTNTRTARSLVLGAMLLAAWPLGSLGATQWPALPSSADAVRALLRRTQHGLHRVPPAPRSAEQIVSRLQRAQRQGEVVAGWRSIRRWIRGRVTEAERRGRSAVLLWGVYHDAAAQLEGFRRAFLSADALGLEAVALELFDARGHWRLSGATAGEQRGDDALLDQFGRTGSRPAWRRLQARQRSYNYTAWKYGYLDGVMDLVAAARAHRVPLLGCDMPLSLRQRLRGLTEGARLRLRELHCLLALRQRRRSRGSPRHVALLWGQQHLESSALPSFFGPKAEPVSLYVFGGRFGPHGVEQRLARRLSLADPLLVPLGGGADSGPSGGLVLLPGPALGLTVDRARDYAAPAPPPNAPPRSGRATPGLSRAVQRSPRASARAGVAVTSERRFVLWLDGRRFGPSRDRFVALPPGSIAYLARSGGRLLAGEVAVPNDGSVSLFLDFSGPSVRQITQLPSEHP